MVVDQVQAHLRAALVFQHQSDALHVGQTAAGSTHMACDTAGDLEIGGGQIDVEGDQHLARADHRRSGGGMQGGRAQRSGRRSGLSAASS